jgi:hypothetical protein
MFKTSSSMYNLLLFLMRIDVELEKLASETRQGQITMEGGPDTVRVEKRDGIEAK